MAACKFCGEWAGVWIHEHQRCELAIQQGMTPAQIRAAVVAESQTRVVKPVTGGTIFWAVLGALTVFAFMGLLIGLVVRSIN